MVPKLAPDVQFGASTCKIHTMMLKLGNLVQIRCQTCLSMDLFLTGLDNVAWDPLSATREASARADAGLFPKNPLD